MLPEKPPPNDVEAEEALLGSLLIDGGMATVVSAVVPDGGSFYSEKNGWVYDAVLALAGQDEPVDFVSVCSQLEQMNRLEAVGGQARVAELIGAVPTSVHAEHYARLVDRAKRLRDAIDAASEIAAMAYAPGADADEVEAKAQAAVLGLGRSEGRGRLLKGHVSEYYDRLEAMANAGAGGGLPTGFPHLDELLGGLAGYVIIAGRPSMGKSSMLHGIIRHLIRYEKKRVALFSLEDSAQMVVNRMVAAEIEADVQELRSGNVRDWPAVMRVVSEYADGEVGERLWIDDSPGLTIQQISARAMRCRAQMGVDLIAVDYLQLARSGDRYRDRNDYTRVSDVSDGLKNLARLAGVPVIAVSQLSRATESRTDKKPMLSDLRQSGTIEQASDFVVFVYRDEYYNPDTTPNPGVADIIVAKNKNGRTGACRLHFEKRCAKFKTVTVSNLDGEYF